MKLIDLLVKELPKRGGWPDGADECYWHSGFSNVYFYNDGCDVECSPGLSTVGINYNGDDEGESVTRAQYEAAIAKNDGWIEWGGGKCPVETGVLVDIRIRNGKESHGVRANESTSGVSHDASYVFWRKDGNGGDIIAYRLHKPEINSRTNDDRLEQDLNECIGQDVDIPEWSGDGVPPVGIECEIYNRSEWFAVKIKFIGDKWIVAEPLEGRNEECFDNQLHGEDCYSIADKPHAFRPLRTEADKRRYKAIHAMSSAPKPCGHAIHDICCEIYDAIAAGKIPGVKLENN